MVLLEYPLCLFFHQVLSGIVSGMLKFLTMIIKLSISIFNSVSFSFTYFEDLLRVVCTLKFFISLNVSTNLSLRNVSILIMFIVFKLMLSGTDMALFYGCYLHDTHLFPFTYFEPVCIFESKVCLSQTA